MYGSALVVRDEAYGNKLLEKLLSEWDVPHHYVKLFNGDKKSEDQSIIIFDLCLISSVKLEQIISQFWFGAGNGFIFIYGTDSEEKNKIISSLKWKDGFMSVLLEARILVSSLVLISDETETLEIMHDSKCSGRVLLELTNYCNSHKIVFTKRGI